MKTQCIRIILYVLAATFVSCSKEDEESGPEACFLTDANGSTDISHNFIFTNCTGPYHTYHWDFGDGYFSNEMNPTHRFNSIGAFNVRMTATDADDKSDESTRTITIGHNTLTKIEVTKANGSIGFPKHIYLTYNNLVFGQSYTMDKYAAGVSAIPFYVSLNDNALYDNNVTGTFLFKEDNLAGQSYNSGSFGISDYDIVNGQIQKTFYYQSDSAKVTLYFKIVPR